MPHVVGATALLYPDDLLILYALCTVYGFLILLSLNSIYSIDTLLYPYTLPLAIHSLTFPQVFA